MGVRGVGTEVLGYFFGGGGGETDILGKGR